jgi:hypothetical protein
MFEYATNRLQWLVGQLAAGWRLEAPVFERLVHRGMAGKTSAFEFVLRNELGFQVVAVNDCPEVRAFLEERGIACINL